MNKQLVIFGAGVVVALGVIAIAMKPRAVDVERERSEPARDPASSTALAPAGSATATATAAAAAVASSAPNGPGPTPSESAPVASVGAPSAPSSRPAAPELAAARAKGVAPSAPSVASVAPVVAAPAALPSAAPATLHGSTVPFQRATDKYRLAASPGPCNLNQPCTVDVKLEGLSGYHINKEYPYKLKAEPSPGVTFARADGVFSKAGGDFTQQGEASAVMKVTFTPTEAHGAKVRGTYKFSVCSASDCKLESADVAFEAPVR